MEETQPTPSKITRTRSMMHRLLEEIDDKIIQFTNLPTGTPSLGLHAQDITKKLAFIKNLLNAEIASNHGRKPHDIAETEGRLTKLEADFYRSNVQPVVNVHDTSEDGESGSGSGSVCECSLNDDRVDDSSVDEKLNEVVAPPAEVCCESVAVSGGEKVETVECKGEVAGGGKRRWWWRIVAVLTTVSAALMTGLSGYLVSVNEPGDFLMPT